MGRNSTASAALVLGHEAVVLPTAKLRATLLPRVRRIWNATHRLAEDRLGAAGKVGILHSGHQPIPAQTFHGPSPQIVVIAAILHAQHDQMGDAGGFRSRLIPAASAEQTGQGGSSSKGTHAL